MQRSFSDWETFFSAFDSNEIVQHFGKLFVGSSLNELAAARERTLAVAFRERETPHDERATAAAWSNVLESLIVLLLAGRPEMHERFLEARNASMHYASEFGYGSIGYAAIHEPNKIASRVFGDESENPDRQSVADRRAFLMSVAFGRSEDAPSSGA